MAKQTLSAGRLAKARCRSRDLNAAKIEAAQVERERQAKALKAQAKALRQALLAAGVKVHKVHLALEGRLTIWCPQSQHSQALAVTAVTLKRRVIGHASEKGKLAGMLAAFPPSGELTWEDKATWAQRPFA